jgi:hypothetical protein
MCFTFVLNKASWIDMADDYTLDDYQTCLKFNTYMALLDGILAKNFKIEPNGHCCQPRFNGLYVSFSSKPLTRLVILLFLLELV